MRLLLDTHALFWWLTKNPSLTVSAQDLIKSRDHTVLVSAVSPWEIATKVRLGKLDVAAEVVANFVFYLERERFQIITINVDHGIRAGSLPGPHKDPFDRMLIAQALAENVPIISNDRALDGYGVRRLW
ncbi:MAG TPA: type II toxin-antitoxin system VapC family toxin [Candidatus Dormibacteraeota bacterium]|nr:type II toxin-antitoxin system VapC family toxin [Candidatus Dormibacteraeota bacterium]